MDVSGTRKFQTEPINQTVQFWSRGSVQVSGVLWHSYRVSLAILDHTVSPATRHKRTHPALTPAMQAGTRYTYPGGSEGWVDLDDLIALRPGIEPVTFRSRVLRSTTAPPRQQQCTLCLKKRANFETIGLQVSGACVTPVRVGTRQPPDTVPYSTYNILTSSGEESLGVRDVQNRDGDGVEGDGERWWGVPPLAN